MSNKYSIEANEVSKIFIKNNIKVSALNNFSIRIPKGSIYGLLGPNGAGKSTFINILGGLVKKNNGSIFIEGVDLDKNIKLTKSKIGIVPQELNIDPFFTPYELLELQAGLYGISKKNRKTNELLLKLGLLEQKKAYARTLSGGMRRRLLIAKALVHDPEVLILDEPTAGVDVELRRNLWNYVLKLNKNGKTICLTTHYLEEAESLCNYITIINKGKILVNDRKEALLNLITTRKVNFELNKTISKIPEELEQFSPECNNLILKISYNKNKNKISDIIKILNLNNITFNEIKTFDEDLESVFIKITKESI